jgi:hypothetical protein
MIGVIFLARRQLKGIKRPTTARPADFHFSRYGILVFPLPIDSSQTPFFSCPVTFNS